MHTRRAEERRLLQELEERRRKVFEPAWDARDWECALSRVAGCELLLDAFQSDIIWYAALERKLKISATRDGTTAARRIPTFPRSSATSRRSRSASKTAGTHWKARRS